MHFVSVSASLVPMLATTATYPTRMVGDHEVVNFPSGLFIMGADRSVVASPAHWVRLRPFSLAIRQVTEFEYRSRVGSELRAGNGGAHFPGAMLMDAGLLQRPVTSVSWRQARAYTQQLRRETGEKVDLPTEAQWECAARGPAVDIKGAMEAEQGQYRPDEVPDFVSGRFTLFYLIEGGRIFSDIGAPGLDDARFGSAPLWGYRLYGTRSGGIVPEEANFCTGRPGSATLQSVDRMIPNAFGIRGLCGGAWDWCRDRPTHRDFHSSGFLSLRGYRVRPSGLRRNPGPWFPWGGQQAIIRGGSFEDLPHHAFEYNPPGLDRLSAQFREFQPVDEPRPTNSFRIAVDRR